MNRIIATTGMAALSAVVMQPAMAQEGTQDGKPWSVSATVRTFYDDNYATLPSHAAAGTATKRSSWGLELTPSGLYKFSQDQNTVDLSARYGMRYYEDRRQNSADHSFDFGADWTHRFTEKLKLNVSELLAIAQEPGVLDAGPVATPLRTQGNNLRNNFQIKGYWDDIIERWSGEVSYGNTLYDYEQTGVASRSALLDRHEHLFSLVGRYRIFDETETDALLGYSLGLTDNTSSDSLTAAAAPLVVSPSSRDSRSHYFFAGMGHKFNPELKGQVRLGFQYTEYPNAASADAVLATIPASPYSRSQTSPYVDASGTWGYLPNSSLQLGLRHTRIATDVNTSVDAEATTVYASLNHEIVAGVKGTLLTQYQQSQFKQIIGQRDAADGLFTVGLTMEWQFHQFVSLEGGYNYDRLDSDLPDRSYYRNRIFVGFKGTW